MFVLVFFFFGPVLVGKAEKVCRRSGKPAVRRGFAKTPLFFLLSLSPNSGHLRLETQPNVDVVVVDVVAAATKICFLVSGLPVAFRLFCAIHNFKNSSGLPVAFRLLCELLHFLRSCPNGSLFRFLCVQEVGVLQPL